MSCLSDENLAALVDDSADTEQSATWEAHIATCDACATRFARKQVGSSRSKPASDAATDPDATITVKPIGKPSHWEPRRLDGVDPAHHMRPWPDGTGTIDQERKR